MGNLLSGLRQRFCQREASDISQHRPGSGEYSYAGNGKSGASNEAR